MIARGASGNRGGRGRRQRGGRGGQALMSEGRWGIEQYRAATDCEPESAFSEHWGGVAVGLAIMCVKVFLTVPQLPLSLTRPLRVIATARLVTLTLHKLAYGRLWSCGHWTIMFSYPRRSGVAAVWPSNAWGIYLHWNRCSDFLGWFCWFQIISSFSFQELVC